MRSAYAVVMAGGSGTRFWPASRRLTPKQLLPLGPEPEVPLIRATVRRLRTLCPPERILIATGAHLLEATRRALPELPPSSFLGEPIARNTAACIGWATSMIHRREPEALALVIPSDHHIADEPGYLAALRTALTSAATGVITTIGILPSRPDTGYGYIQMGEHLSDGVREAKRFVEKPDRATAERYLRDGSYAWNSGMFFFSTSTMRQALRDHAPVLSAQLDRLEASSATGPAAEELLRDVFESVPSISIDYAVMEKQSRLNVVPAEFGWSDLGSWESAWELAEKDSDGNALQANVIAADSQRNLVRDLCRDAPPRVVALVGAQDLCVVQTDDAVLVMPRERAQDVRLIVDELKRRGRHEKL